MNQTSKSYWENYYAKHRNPGPPSPFAQFATPFLSNGGKLLEIGCGNGRDSSYFAELGLQVTSVDQCSDELDYLNDKYAESPNLKFTAGDMGELPTLGPLNYVYSRFSIHSVDRATEARVFNWAAANIVDGGLFMIEVRSINDQLCGQGEKVGEHEYRTDHYRRFVVKSEIEQLAKDKGFRVLYSLESQGLAVYKDEDPAVIRLVLQK
jgi:ubiquinone/menaquinone biosynthesis C-methylase UbiE